MTRQEYNDILPGQSMVICPKIDRNNPAGGWCDKMDSMVGVPFIVQSKHMESIRLQNDDGTFSFHYSIVEMYDNTNKRKEIVLEGTRFVCNDKVSLYSLLKHCLRDDANKIKKLCKAKDYLPLDLKTLEAIQETCPRCMGILLSNNFIQRV